MLVNIAEIKTQLETHTFDLSKIHIFICDKDNILLNHYLGELGKTYDIIYVDSFELLPDNLGFSVESNNIYVCKCAELKNSDLSNIESKLPNSIIVINKLEKDDLENSIVTSFPKLDDWMVQDYCKHLLPGVKEEDVEYLISITKGDNRRLLKEVEKISIFDVTTQQQEFDLLRNGNDWNDLQTLNIWDFINYIQRKDFNGMSTILSKIENIDIEGTGVVTSLLSSFRKIIDIQMNPSATAESLNMSPKQFKAITYSCNRFSNTQLIRIYEFLTSIDFKLKNGELQLSNSKLVDYIICNIFRM